MIKNVLIPGSADPSSTKGLNERMLVQMAWKKLTKNQQEKIQELIDKGSVVWIDWIDIGEYSYLTFGNRTKVALAKIVARSFRSFTMGYEGVLGYEFEPGPFLVLEYRDGAWNQSAMFSSFAKAISEFKDRLTAL